MSKAYMSIYWGQRPLASPQFSGLLRELLLQLTKVASLDCESWKAMARDDVIIARITAASRNRNDVEQQVIEELGFATSIDHPTGVTLYLSVGVVAPRLPNHIMLSSQFFLGYDALQEGLLRSVVDSTSALACLVDLCDPEWGTVCSDDLREIQRGPSGEIAPPVIGWLTYVSRTSPHADAFQKVGASRWKNGWLLRASPTFDTVTKEAVLELRRSVVE